LTDWIAVLNEHVSQFEERVEIRLRACNNISIAIEASDNVMHKRQKFSISVENVKKIVDELSTAGFPDLSTG
jgi:hypothetical protein